MAKGRVVRRRRSSFGTSGLIRNVFRTGMGLRRAFSNTRTSTKRRSSEMQPLTSEKDVRTVYRKRRMPRRKRKAYVRKIKGFRSLQMRNEPSRIFMYVNATGEDSGANTSNYFGNFYGLCSQDGYSNSLRKVYNQFTNNTAADQKAFASHLRIDHMSLTIILRNSTTAVVGGSGVIDLDVYKVVCIKDIPNSVWVDGTDIQAMLQTLAGRLNTAVGQDIEVGDTGTGIATTASGNVNSVGSMLWNTPNFLRYWKILKQTKIQISPGQIIQLNMRTSRNKIASYEECSPSSSSGRLAAKKGLTAGYIFNQNGRWERLLNGWQATTLEVEYFTRYNIKPLLPTADTYVYN